MTTAPPRPGRPGLPDRVLPDRSAPAWSSPAGVAAAVVVLVAVSWRAVILGRGWFSQNDFLLILPGTPLDDLTAPAGFSPGSVLIARVVADLAPLSWPVAAAVTVGFVTATLLASWLLLTAILPGRWLRLPLFTLLATTPLTLWSTQWWTFALQFWPGALAVVVAALAVVRSVSGGRGRSAPWVVGCALALALSVNERWVLAPVVLGGLALCVAPGRSLRDRARHTLTGQWMTWLVTVVVLVGYVVVRSLVSPLTLGGVQSPGALVTAYLRHVGALLAGGPWGSGVVVHAYLTPPSVAVGVGMLVLLAVVAVTVARGRLTARIAWVTVAVHTAASLALLAVLRQGGLAASLDLIHRFGADAALVVVLLLAAAFREIRVPALAAPPVIPWRGTPLGTPKRAEAALAAVAVVVLAVSAAASTPALAAPLYHADDRRLVETARAALRADPTVVLLDSGVPAQVMSPWFGDRARVSTLLARAPEVPAFDLPSQRLRLVAADGRLTPVLLSGSVAMVPGEDAACPRPVRSAGALVPLQGLVPEGRWVVRLGYYTGTAGLMTMDVAGRRIEVPVQSGLNATDVVVTGTFDELILSLDDDAATLCLATLEVGVPRPGAP